MYVAVGNLALGPEKCGRYAEGCLKKIIGKWDSGWLLAGSRCSKVVVNTDLTVLAPLNIFILFHSMEMIPFLPLSHSTAKYARSVFFFFFLFLRCLWCGRGTNKGWKKNFYKAHLVSQRDCLTQHFFCSFGLKWHCLKIQ